MPTSPQTTQSFDASTARLLTETREWRSSAPPARERAVETFLAAATLLAAVLLALLVEPARPISLPVAALFVVLYAAVNRVEFTIGDGIVVPTQLVFVPMLLLVPTPLVPLLVAAGLVGATCIDVGRGARVPARIPLAVSDAGYALAPALVLIALDAQLPAWSSWPAYVAALAAQFGVDALRESARGLLTARMDPRTVIAELSQIFRVDLLLAPVGLLVAMAAADTPAAAVLVLPLVSLLGSFAREREARIAQTIELSSAYRGTAMLLCDLLEDDDEYTGHHTHDVVDLSVLVAERIGVGEDVRRETELGAMLHDIGKIHIPDAIINKPGKLDADEWALMKTHTIEGQRMLDRVGGLLASVGLVVRGSHERFDGGGYPDGLAGEAIPLASRIVAASDAFNAMTTTRSYRKAMPVAAAVDELHRCSGSQFDPAVIAALVAVVGDPGWQLTVRAEPQSSPPYASAKNSGSVARNPDSSSSSIVTVTPVT